ncbi:MAG: hypothetical protein BRD55_07205 [Bacteroidetes bacterium SW_9_63_38]|nr:MAG: hypothetical protein BRD55_07205 [Bacteroidetes bacterium SW_9_63_38]
MVSSIIAGLRRAGLVLLIGGLAGIAVRAGGESTIQIQTWSPVVLGNSILVGVLYVALLDATLQLVRPIMKAFVPLESERHVWYHTLAPAGSTLLVIIGLTAGLKTALGTAFTPDWPMLTRIGILVALGTGSVYGLLALQAYYQRDHKDHAEGWEARMRRLRTQTCPPIVLGTLAAAGALLEDDASDQAAPLIDDARSLLRYRHEAGSAETVPLAHEIEVVLWYVELAQVQYGADLEVGFDLPDSLLSVQVPRLCLLPLLENAVQHGARALDEPCTITVTGRHDEQEMCLAVLDTGPGFDTTDPTTILRRGSGIADLYARLREHYGAGTDLSLLPQGVLWCAPVPDAEEAPSPSEEQPSMPSPPE